MGEIPTEIGLLTTLTGLALGMFYVLSLSVLFRRVPGVIVD